MRLIDADALMQDIKSNAYIIRDVFNSTDEGMSINGIQYAINNAPTIVPTVTPKVSEDCDKFYKGYCSVIVVERKRGFWRKTEHQGETFWKCSQCGLIHKYASNYCDSCGADMRGEEE